MGNRTLYARMDPGLVLFPFFLLQIFILAPMPGKKEEEEEDSAFRDLITRAVVVVLRHSSLLIVAESYSFLVRNRRLCHDLYLGLCVRLFCIFLCERRRKREA